jgi:protein arginine kinase
MNRISKSFFPQWLTKDQGDYGTVISTRIRLARNFQDLCFPQAAGPKEQEKALQRIEAFTRQNVQLRLKLQRLQDQDETQRGLLFERGLISMASVQEPDKIALACTPGQNISLLINEEDHLRIQVMQEGEGLTTALETAQDLDDSLGSKLSLACHRQFGFLTACPTNVGTGLRASVMLHLPALALTRGIVQMLKAVLHIGLAVRGFYGEETELRSVFFQISNHMTLGRTEEEIIKHLAGVVRQVVEREEEARRILLKEKRQLLEDKVGRALGILTGCRMLGLEEALDLLSAVRLGMETGVIERIKKPVLNEMLLLVQPAHLQAFAGKSMKAEEQMAWRAELIRKRLKLGKKS